MSRVVAVDVFPPPRSIVAAIPNPRPVLLARSNTAVPIVQVQHRIHAMRQPLNPHPRRELPGREVVGFDFMVPNLSRFCIRTFEEKLMKAQKVAHSVSLVELS